MTTGAPLRSIVLSMLFGDAHRFLDQSLDDLRLGHRLDDLALDEDLALAVAGRHTEVSLTCFTRSVHDATHDGHAQRDLHAFEAGRDLVGKCVDIDLCTATRRA